MIPVLGSYDATATGDLSADPEGGVADDGEIAAPGVESFSAGVGSPTQGLLPRGS